MKEIKITRNMDKLFLYIQPNESWQDHIAHELTSAELHQFGSLCLDMANNETITELSMKIGNNNETIYKDR